MLAEFAPKILEVRFPAGPDHRGLAVENGTLRLELAHAVVRRVEADVEPADRHGRDQPNREGCVVTLCSLLEYSKFTT